MICNQVPLFVGSSFTDAKDKLCVLYAGGNATWLFCNLGKCHFWPICSIDVRHVVSLLPQNDSFTRLCLFCVAFFKIFPFLFHLIQWATISLRVGEDRSEDRIWMQTNLSQSSYLPIVWVKYSSPSLSLSLSSNLLLFELNTAYNTIFARIFPLCYLINWGSLIDCYRFLLSIARSLTYLRASSDRDFSFLLDLKFSLTSWKCVATFTKFVATLPPSSPRL